MLARFASGVSGVTITTICLERTTQFSVGCNRLRRERKRCTEALNLILWPSGRRQCNASIDERVRAVYDGIEYNATVLHQIGINSLQLRFESDEGPWDRATSRARMRKAD